MTYPAFDPATIARETEWLKNNPAFEERPATITEFLADKYLGIEKKIRPGLKDALVHIFGKDVSGHRISVVERAMVTGAIGIGKTTFASIALPYMTHWVLCLRDPQDFFNLLPGSRIAFMQMSTSEDQAKEVVFGDIKARIENSDWFVNNYPHDPKFTNQIRFPKDIWVLPGDSAETTFEGYNILGGILDEMDSHKVTKDKDYAEQGYNTINSRIASRFTDEKTNRNLGLLICVGQMKKGVGFAASKYQEFLSDPDAYVVRQTIWESFGWQRYQNEDGTRDSFFYDTRRKEIVAPEAALLINSDNVIEIPEAYRNQFMNKPELALRDLAGIPPSVKDPFISLADKVTLCVDKWVERVNADSPVTDSPTRPDFFDWFKAVSDARRRAIHIDLAYSGDGDACGIAMGHVSKLVDIDNEIKPYIIIDCILRMRAPAGQEIMLSAIRQYIYTLRYDLNFKIKTISLDGFQSIDTKQQLRKRKFWVEDLSVDKTTGPYEDLREAIYEERIEFPKYMTFLNRGDTKLVEIAVKELLELQDTGRKVDHPAGGSKDVADALAGVTFTLMGDRQYRKGAATLRHFTEQVPDQVMTSRNQKSDTEVMAERWGVGGLGDFSAPPSAGSALGLSVPSRLKPRG